MFKEWFKYVFIDLIKASPAESDRMAMERNFSRRLETEFERSREYAVDSGKSTFHFEALRLILRTSPEEAETEMKKMPEFTITDDFIHKLKSKGYQVETVFSSFNNIRHSLMLKVKL